MKKKKMTPREEYKALFQSVNAERSVTPAKGKFKQRMHITIGEIDHYPEIDKFIPRAVAMANAKFPMRNTGKHINFMWDKYYHKCMDSILVKEGLRVI